VINVESIAYFYGGITDNGVARIQPDPQRWQAMKTPKNNAEVKTNHLSHISILLLSGAFVLLPIQSKAATTTYTWTGGGSDNYWSDATNWGGTAPTTNGATAATGTNVIINLGLTAASSPVVDTNNPWYAQTINIVANSGNVSLSGNALTLSGATAMNAGVAGTFTITIANNLNLSNTVSTQIYSGNASTGNLNISGNITSSVATSGYVLFRGNGTNSIVSGIISPTAGTALTVTKSGNGVWTFSNASNVISTFQATQGTTKIGANDGIGTSAALTLGNSGVLGGAAYFDLNGFNQHITGLSVVSNNNAANTSLAVKNSSATASTLTYTKSSDETYAGALLGNLSFIKNGTGALTLSGALGGLAINYTGTTAVNAGSLVVNTDLSAATGAVSVASAATLAGSGTIGGAVTTSGTITGSLTFNKDVTISSGATAAATAFNGNIINNGTITSAINIASGKTLSGSGTANVTVTGSNATVNGSGLILGSTTFTGASTLGGTVTTSNLTISSGTTSLTGSANTTGSTSVVSGATLATTGTLSGALGNSGLLNGNGAINGTVVNSGTIAGSLTFGNNVTINGGATAAAAAFNGNIIDNGTITSALNIASGKTLSGSGTANVTVTGSNATINGSGLNIGATTLSGSSTLSGYNIASRVTVNSGTTLLTGTTQSTGTLSVSAEATLNANGTIAGSANVSGLLNGNSTVTGNLTLTSGTLAPGNGTGITTVGGNFTVDHNSTLVAQVSGTVAEISYDQVKVSGNVSLDGTLDLTKLSGLTLGETITLIDNTGSGTTTGYFSTILTSGSTYTVTSNSDYTFISGTTEYLLRFSANADSGSSFNDVTLTVVPEPGTWAMVLGGIGMLAFGQRLRRRC